MHIKVVWKGINRFTPETTFYSFLCKKDFFTCWEKLSEFFQIIHLKRELLIKSLEFNILLWKWFVTVKITWDFMALSCQNSLDFSLQLYRQSKKWMFDKQGRSKFLLFNDLLLRLSACDCHLWITFLVFTLINVKVLRKLLILNIYCLLFIYIVHSKWFNNLERLVTQFPCKQLFLSPLASRMSNRTNMGSPHDF